MPTQTTRIVMNGITGRMGYRQHLLANEARLFPDPDLAAGRLHEFLGVCGARP